jgi:hypothetical protein
MASILDPTASTAWRHGVGGVAPGPGSVRRDLGQRRRFPSRGRPLEQPRGSGSVLLDRSLDGHSRGSSPQRVPGAVHIVEPKSIPNPNWLRPGIPGAGQQAFGDALLARHKFVVIPSAVSNNSWNLIFVASGAAGAYALRSQERFALDTRLHPPTAL